jgi:4-amino-4-deoxy-L-arabinose transferase-like glycosyltransferase
LFPLQEYHWITDEMPTEELDEEPKYLGPPDLGPVVWVTGVVLALMVIGAFGPWAKAPLGVTVSGTDGSNDGWLVVGAAAVGALFLWARARSRSRGPCLVIGLVGGGALAVSVHDRTHISNLNALISVGWGLNLDLVASALLVVMAALLMVYRGDFEEVPVAVEPVFAAAGNDVASRLERLGGLREKNLISAEEFEAKRAEILTGI